MQNESTTKQEKMDKVNNIKDKNFCSPKDTIKRVKRATHKAEENTYNTYFWQRIHTQVYKDQSRI